MQSPNSTKCILQIQGYTEGGYFRDIPVCQQLLQLTQDGTDAALTQTAFCQDWFSPWINVEEQSPLAGLFLFYQTGPHVLYFLLQYCSLRYKEKQVNDQNLLHAYFLPCYQTSLCQPIFRKVQGKKKVLDEDLTNSCKFFLHLKNITVVLLLFLPHFASPSPLVIHFKQKGERQRREKKRNLRTAAVGIALTVDH